MKGKGRSAMISDRMIESLQNQFTQALKLQEANQLKAALLLFEQILSTVPDHPESLHSIGLIYAQRQDFSRALAYFERAVFLEPKQAHFHNHLGNTYKALGRWQEAQRHYYEALRLKTPYPEVYNNLGSLFYRLGNYEEAVRQFQKALRVRPQSAEAHYNLAHCYVKQDRFLDAITHYQQTLLQQPSHLGALHNLSMCLCFLKRFQEALPLLTQVIAEDPENQDVLFYLGVIHNTFSDFEKAKAYYQQVLQYNPQHANAHHNLATLHLACHRLELALSHYQKALSLEPQNATAKHMIAALTGQTLPSGAPSEYITVLFDQYAYNYDQHVQVQLQYQVPYLIRQALTPFIPAQGFQKALDIGCGTGLLAPFLTDIIHQFEGIDLSPNMLAVAKQKGAYSALTLAEAAQFLKTCYTTYHLIVAADVLVYFGELETLFRFCRQALKAKGYFSFSIETLSLAEIPNLPHADFALRKTGRYAHRVLYIHTLSQQLGFNLLAQDQVTLRYQENKPIVGHLFILQKPA